MHNDFTLFGLNSSVSVGDNRLFLVNVSDQECTAIQSLNEFMMVLYLAILNGLTCRAVTLNKVLVSFPLMEEFCRAQF